MCFGRGYCSAAFGLSGLLVRPRRRVVAPFSCAPRGCIATPHALVCAFQFHPSFRLSRHLLLFLSSSIAMLGGVGGQGPPRPRAPVHRNPRPKAPHFRQPRFGHGQEPRVASGGEQRGPQLAARRPCLGLRRIAGRGTHLSIKKGAKSPHLANLSALESTSQLTISLFCPSRALYVSNSLYTVRYVGLFSYNTNLGRSVGGIQENRLLKTATQVRFRCS